MQVFYFCIKIAASISDVEELKFFLGIKGENEFLEEILCPLQLGEVDNFNGGMGVTGRHRDNPRRDTCLTECARVCAYARENLGLILYACLFGALYQLVAHRYACDKAEVHYLYADTLAEEEGFVHNIFRGIADGGCVDGKSDIGIDGGDSHLCTAQADLFLCGEDEVNIAVNLGEICLHEGFDENGAACLVVKCLAHQLVYAELLDLCCICDIVAD